MTCKNCGNEIWQEMLYCPFCGHEVEDEEEQARVCPQCGRPAEADDAFCGACGARLTESDTGATNPTLIQSMKSDLQQSQTVQTAKAQLSSLQLVSPRTWLLIGAGIIALIFVIILFSNIHKCDYCGDFFFGEPYHFFGMEVCDDCWNS